MGGAAKIRENRRSEIMRKHVGVIALAVAGALGFGGTYAMATDHGIPAIKFIVVNKPARGSQ
jgi:hypothetical protein